MIILVLIITLFTCDFLVKKHASEKCTSDISNLKNAKIGLLLGTSKYLPNGYENLYYRNRII